MSVSAASGVRRRRTGHGRGAPVAAAVPLVVAGLMVVAVVGGMLETSTRRAPAGPSAAEVAALTAYEKAILPIVRDWGSVEMLGMRPAVADLQAGTGVPAATVAVEAAAWRSALELDRVKLRAVKPPRSLREASGLFDAAIVRYLDAADLFRRAALSPASARGRLIAAGIAAAEAGDRVYDDASAVIQAARSRLGLTPSADFPDHPRSP